MGGGGWAGGSVKRRVECGGSTWHYRATGSGAWEGGHVTTWEWGAGGRACHYMGVGCGREGVSLHGSGVREGGVVLQGSGVREGVALKGSGVWAGGRGTTGEWGAGGRAWYYRELRSGRTPFRLSSRVR